MSSDNDSDTLAFDLAAESIAPAAWPMLGQHRGEAIMTRSLSAIADDIRATWPKPYFGAVPYLNAMHSLWTIRDGYGADDGRTIVLYFLSNANTWRGDDARRIKAELRQMLDAS